MKINYKFALEDLNEESKQLHDDIISLLKEQEDHVNSATFMENFSKDYDISTKCGHDVCQGLLVSLDGEYKLTSKDNVWLTPELFKTTSMFETQAVNDDLVANELKECSEEDDVEGMNSMNSLIGHYKNTTVDSLGIEKQTNYTLAILQPQLVH